MSGLERRSEALDSEGARVVAELRFASLLRPLTGSRIIHPGLSFIGLLLSITVRLNKHRIEVRDNVE